MMAQFVSVYFYSFVRVYIYIFGLSSSNIS